MLSLSCFFSPLYFSRCFALSSLSLYLFTSFSFASSLLLHRSGSFCLALSPSSDLSQSFSFVSHSRFFCFPPLFLFSAFPLPSSHLSSFTFLPSFLRPSSLAECSASYWVSVSKPSSTRSSVVCDRPVLDRCDAGSRTAPMEVTKLSLWESQYLACSRACWNAELANRSRKHKVFVLVPDAARVVSSKELAPSSTSSLEGKSSHVPLRPPRTSPLAPVDTLTDVLKALISTVTIPPPVFKISDFEKIEYRANFLNADHPAQASCFTDPGHVEKLSIVFRESKWWSKFGSFSVARKSSLSDRLSVLFSAFGGRLILPLYPCDGFHRRATSRTVGDSVID